MIDTKKMQEIINNFSTDNPNVIEATDPNIKVEMTRGIIPIALVDASDYFFKYYMRDLRDYEDILRDLVVDNPEFNSELRHIRNTIDNLKNRPFYNCVAAIETYTDRPIGYSIGKLELGDCVYNVGLLGFYKSALEATGGIKDEYFIKKIMSQVQDKVDNNKLLQYGVYHKYKINIPVMAVNLIKIIDKGTDNSGSDYIGECHHLTTEILGIANDIAKVCGFNCTKHSKTDLINVSYLNDLNYSNTSIININNDKYINADVEILRDSTIIDVGRAEDIEDCEIFNTLYNECYLGDKLLKLNIPYGYDLSQSFKAKYI